MFKLVDWKVHPKTCTLVRVSTGEEVKLSPRTMDVLIHLIEAEGEVVSSSELLDRHWNKSVSSDHAVHNAIAELRGALGDSANNPRYIKTYPKRGYSLLALPEELPARTDPEQPPIASRRFLSPEPVLRHGMFAVAAIVLLLIAGLTLDIELPSKDPTVLLVRRLENLNVEAENRFWADQLPASLVTRLSMLPDTIIVSEFEDPGAQAYVQDNLQNEIDYILGGNVQQANDALRLQVNFIDARDNSVVVSNQFDISSAQVFAVQDQIGRNIVSALSIYLDEEQSEEMRDWGTNSPAAYSHFLEGGFYAANSNHTDLEMALEHYRAATEEDPGFVNAYIGLARAANSLASYSHEARSRELLDVVSNSIREVSRIDSQHESLTELRVHLLRLQGASSELVEESLRRAILEDNADDFVYSAYGVLLAEARMYDEASRFLDLAGEDDPFKIPIRATWLYQTFFELPDSLIQTQKSILLERPDHLGVLSALIRGLAFVGDHRQAMFYLQRQMELDEEGPFTMLSQSIISGLWGASTAAGDLFEANNRDNPDFSLAFGIKSFIRGNLEEGIDYWRSLSPVDARRLSMMAHKVEMYFPSSVIEDADYQHLLDELGLGLSWQRRLMEGVQQMAPLTGVGLGKISQQAYANNQFLIENNLWDHSAIAYPNREGQLPELRRLDSSAFSE
jgi:DNA-binding winged helix-turn-helix (wHTH) protein/TolB-like protein